MGVVYKLTPEITSFIIQQKQKDPAVSCQNLAGMVFSRFGQQVSKSSVHELLKQAHVIVPRARKIKEKFQIPSQKKAEILKALEPFVMEAPSPGPFGKGPDMATVPAKALGDPEATFHPPALKQEESSPDKGDIFLRCALWDLSFKPVLGLKDFYERSPLDDNKLKMEWEYLNQWVYAIKLELEDNSHLFIDCRHQSLYAKNPDQVPLAVPVERAACEGPDYVLNNLRPLIIRNLVFNGGDTAGVDFMAAFENLPGKKISKISLVGSGGQNVAEFSSPLAQKRQFIAGIPYDCKGFQWAIGDPRKELDWQLPLNSPEKTSPLRILKKERVIVVTNLISMSYDKVMQMYLDRHPANNYNVSPIDDSPQGDITDQAGWLKARLKGRALMFFPSGTSLSVLEKILALPGVEVCSKDSMEIRLDATESFEYTPQLKSAVENINSLNIMDYKAKKIHLSICR